MIPVDLSQVKAVHFSCRYLNAKKETVLNLHTDFPHPQDKAKIISRFGCQFALSHDKPMSLRWTFLLKDYTERSFSFWFSSERVP